jgi:hypothetical protein
VQNQKVSLTLKELKDQINQETRLAWLAGFIDGEGCFLIQRQKKTGQIVGRIELKNLDIYPMQEIREILGDIVGSGKKKFYSKYSPRDEEAGTKKEYVHLVVIHDPHDLRLLIEGILPYLKSKSAEAKELYEWTEYKLSLERGDGGKDKVHNKFITRLRLLKEKVGNERNIIIP